MDLKIAGKTAIICAASHGLGNACARALANEGVNVIINGRTADTLEAAAEAIRKNAPDISVKTVVGSVTDKACRAAMIEAANGEPDILVNNAGGPPSRRFP